MDQNHVCLSEIDIFKIPCDVCWNIGFNGFLISHPAIHHNVGFNCNCCNLELEVTLEIKNICKFE